MAARGPPPGIKWTAASLFRYYDERWGAAHLLVRLFWYLDGILHVGSGGKFTVARQRVERFRCVRTGEVQDGTTGTQLANVSTRAAHRRASSLRHICGDELAQDGAEDMRIVARVRLGGGRFA